MMMLSRYPIVKLHPFNTSFISFWKYDGAWANQNGTLLNWYLPRDDRTNADFDFADSVNLMW